VQIKVYMTNRLSFWWVCFVPDIDEYHLRADYCSAQLDSHLSQLDEFCLLFHQEWRMSSYSYGRPIMPSKSCIKKLW